MNRRGFLAALLGGAVLDPERLLWKPGKKTIFIPQPRLHYLTVEFEINGDRWNRHVYDGYVLPAAAALADTVDSHVVDHMMPMVMPLGLVHAAPVPIGNGRYARALVAWDVLKRKYVGRVDTVFVGLEKV